MKKLFLFGSVFLFVQSLSAQGNGVIIRKNEKSERETEITTKNNTDVGPYTITKLSMNSYLFMDSLVMGAAKLHNNKVIVAPVLYNLKTEKITPQIEGKVEEFYDTYFSVGRHKFTYINGHYYEIIKDRKIKFLKRYDCKVIEKLTEAEIIKTLRKLKSFALPLFGFN